MNVDHALLDELAEKIADGLKLLGHVKQEAEAQIRSILEGVFANLDIVTGERMQVQEALLAKTREEIKALEQQLKELEAKLKQE